MKMMTRTRMRKVSCRLAQASVAMLANAMMMLRPPAAASDHRTRDPLQEATEEDEEEEEEDYEDKVASTRAWDCDGLSMDMGW